MFPVDWYMWSIITFTFVLLMLINIIHVGVRCEMHRPRHSIPVPKDLGEGHLVLEVHLDSLLRYFY
jgi:hypothetical protein